MNPAEHMLMNRLRHCAASDEGEDLLDCMPPGNHGPATIAAKELYFSLLQPHSDASTQAQSRHFLVRQLERAMDGPADLSADMENLQYWVRSNSGAVGSRYRQYLAGRHKGEPRRYFPARSHALHFLRAVAPTKMVDGAWLYGLASQWRDPRYNELIQIYLEELGEGDPSKNHVLVYKKLLAAHECTQWQGLDERHFVQGAIQLSLARHAREFLPEVIGFNLGYEQLPLHLLVCAYELNELGIDPYYFTLHITIDNAATGHAARAVRSVADAMPHLGDRKAFYQRVRNGYRLNSMGAGTEQLIAGFDLRQELLDVLASKAAIGGPLHSDYCRVAGKTVSEWLAAPKGIAGFVDALEKAGWIRRHEPPENSRFWNLLAGDRGRMFGVFNAYERQVIRDWIAGDSLQDEAMEGGGGKSRSGPPPASSGNLHASLQPDACSTPWRAHFHALQGQDQGSVDDDFIVETDLLRERLAQAPDRSAAMDMLVPWLSPVHHHTPAGLMATRLFSQWLHV